MRKESKTKVHGFWFSLGKLESITGLDNLDTSKVIDFSSMFSGCSELKELNISCFNTSSAKYMDHMFAGLESVDELDLHSFETSNVISMEGMFEFGGYSVLSLSNFDTSQVINMNSMFNYCTNIKNRFVII